MSYLDHGRVYEREVLPAPRSTMPSLARWVVLALLGAAALMSSVHQYLDGIAPRPRVERIIERVEMVPTPWLCEDDHGVWRRCRWGGSTGARSADLY